MPAIWKLVMWSHHSAPHTLLHIKRKKKIVYYVGVLYELRLSGDISMIHRHWVMDHGKMLMLENKYHSIDPAKQRTEKWCNSKINAKVVVSKTKKAFCTDAVNSLQKISCDDGTDGWMVCGFMLVGIFMDKAALIKLGHWLDFELNKKSIEEFLPFFSTLFLAFFVCDRHRI